MHWRDLANPAGALTLARLPLAVLFPLVARDREWALAVYVTGIATDAVDGAIARRSGTTSQAGAFADGVSDKVFHAAVAASLASSAHLPPGWLAAWFAREIGQGLVAPWFLWRYREEPQRERRANVPGKLTTGMLGLAVTATLLDARPVARAATLATGVLGVLSVATYIVRERKAHRR